MRLVEDELLAMLMFETKKMFDNDVACTGIVSMNAVTKLKATEKFSEEVMIGVGVTSEPFFVWHQVEA